MMSPYSAVLHGLKEGNQTLLTSTMITSLHIAACFVEGAVEVHSAADVI